jgi:dipeptidyl aminopeptidase/acylaminoacyl peptidase
VQDEVFHIADARVGRDGLRAHGFPIEWKELPNAGHDYATYAAAVNQAAWEFFKQHQLDADPQYRDYQFRK